MNSAWVSFWLCEFAAKLNSSGAVRKVPLPSKVVISELVTWAAWADALLIPLIFASTKGNAAEVFIQSKGTYLLLLADVTYEVSNHVFHCFLGYDH